MASIDMESMRQTGVIYKAPSKNHSKEEIQRKVEPHVLVKHDGMEWVHFNTYNGELGKKGKLPSFKKIVNHNLVGNMEAIDTYLCDKGYAKM